MCDGAERGSFVMIAPPSLPQNAALFLDFDGTLIEFADRPDAVLVPASLPVLLGALQRKLEGALALLSGRTLDELDAFLQPLTFPAAGNHGRDLRWSDGTLEPATIPDITHELQEVERFASTRPGLLVERKAGAVALHYREAPGLEQDVRAFMTELAQARDDLALMPNKMLFELKDAVSNKGAALFAHMQRSPFTGRVPVFIGDDANDEPGMAAAQSAGGFAIKVGDGETCARYRVPNVRAVHAWLGETL